MTARLFVANNFALYQASGTDGPGTMYLHSGLDVILPNGTPVHAVEAGRVRAVVDGGEFYQTLVVEDEDEPDAGWGYTHVARFQVRVGDRVPQGRLLARVHFRGLEHVHMTRFVRPAGGRWDALGTLHAVQPDTFFAYADAEPPAFDGPPRYYRNETDSALARGADGRPRVAGDVDIVVGMRDPAPHARSAAYPMFGDGHHAVTRVEYELAGPLGAPGARRERRASFDLGRLPLVRGPAAGRAALEASTVFKYYPAVRPPGSPPYWNGFAYYVVTNWPADGRAGPVAADDRERAWRTAERAPGGAPLWPDGDYAVTVRAWDFKGNTASRTDTVRVTNGTR
jgi:hypothetical protein